MRCGRGLPSPINEKKEGWNMKTWKHISTILLVCLVMLSFAVEAVVVSPDVESNLLRNNYSFEVEASTTWPENWFSADSTVTFKYITDGTPGVNTHSGTHAISMSNPTGNNGRWFNDKDGILTPGTKYLLSFWFKTENFSTGTVMLPVIDWVEKGVSVKGTYWGQRVTRNTDWTKYEVILTPHPDANFATISVRLENPSGGTGTVYIDDIYFGPYEVTTFTGVVKDANPQAPALLPGASVTLYNPASYPFTDNIKYSTTTDVSGAFSFANIPAGQYNIVVERPGFRPYSQVIELPQDNNMEVSLVATGFVNNLVSNSNFEEETSTGGQPVFWTPAGGLPVEYKYIIAGMPGENTYSGNKAIAMANPTGTDGRWFSTRFSVEGGKQYVLAFWLKADGLENGARFYPVIEWTGASASFFPSVLQNQDWSYYVHKFTVPTSATQAVITLKFEDQDGGADGKGTVYIDDIYFGPVESLEIRNAALSATAFSPALAQTLTISYEVNMSSVISAEIFNKEGTRVYKVQQGPLIGQSTIEWNGKDESNNNCPDGDYVLRLTATDGIQQSNVDFEFTLDSTGPESVEIIEPVAENEFVSHNLDYLEMIVKTSEPNALVKVFRGEVEVGSGSADLSGTVTSLRVEPLLEGENLLTVVAYDSLGNPSVARPTLKVYYDPDLVLGIIKITNGDIFSPENRRQKMSIAFHLKEGATVALTISTAGEEVYSFVEDFPAGSDLVLEWDGKDKDGNWVADGSYTYLLRVEFTTGEVGTRQGVVIVDNTPPKKPSLLYPAAGASVSSTTPLLRWEKLADADYYYVMYSDNDEFIGGELASSLENTFKLPKLEQGTYYWKVKAVDRAGNESEWSDSWQFTIEELDTSTFQISNFFAYPNPFSPDQDGIMDELVIGFTLQQPGNVTLTIYNLAGQMVLKRELGELAWGDHQIIWNGKNQQNQRVQKGVYILRLAASNPNYAAEAAIVKRILVLY